MDDALVKQVGCALLVVGVVVVVFLGVVVFVIGGGDDQGDLTKEAEGTLLDSVRQDAPRQAGRDYDYELVYSYRIDGQEYRGTTELTETEWEPGDPVRLCVDPDEPTAHVVNVEAKPCGSGSVNPGRIRTGTPQ